MTRRVMLVAAVTLLIVGAMSDRLQAVAPVNNVNWTGGVSGEWNTGSVWTNTTTATTGTAATIFGQTNGSDGMDTTSMATTRARNIVIGGGSVVEYNRTIPNSDLRLRQGTSLTVKEGAVWQQSSAAYLENAWTQIDVSNLTLDNGTFRRSGESLGGDGGGLVMFGSYRDDESFEELGGPAKININIKNGGKIENTGQMWFGADDEHSPDTRASITINGGSMDLTGGTIPQSNSTLSVDADLAFFYDYSESLGRPKNEQWEINFTGPGSITVDSAGINVYRQDSSSIWTGGAAVTYLDLWNQGILKANGLSGVVGEIVPSGINDNNRARVAANFNDFFTVSGTAGTNNYILTSVTPQVATVNWSGGASGEWNTGSVWTNTTTATTGTAATIFGQTNGSDGMDTTSMATTRARNIVIGGGSVVEYNRTIPNSDLRLRQGTSLTIKEGAVLQQSSAAYLENAWTQIDVSNLTLDNGTFRRSGQSLGGDGGGLLMFGSYRDDESFEELGGPAKINIQIKNGGKIENTGQMWFGADDEHSPDTRASITINGGSMDLTGGTIPQSNSTLSVDADLAFFYDYSESLGRPKNEQWEINFTGPGSITVDSAGINVYRQDSSSIWTGGAAVTYLDLWNQGILKANGLSGVVGEIVPSGINDNNRARVAANFNDFFTVTGTAGTDNYILNSLIASASLAGDYNNNGTVDAADYVMWRNGDSPDDLQAGYDLWKANFGKTAGSGSGSGSGLAAVPEPSALLLLVAGVLGLVGSARGRKQ